MRDQLSDKVSSQERGERFYFFSYSQTDTEKQRVKTVEELVVWKAKGPNGNLMKGEKCPLTGFWFWENIAKCGCKGNEDDDEHDDEDDYYDDDYDGYDDDDYDYSDYEYGGDYN